MLQAATNKHKGTVYRIIGIYTAKTIPYKNFSQSKL